MKARKRSVIISLWSTLVVVVAIFAISADVKIRRNQEIDAKIEKFILEAEGNQEEYHVDDVEEIDGRIYAVLEYIPEGREGRLYLVEFWGDEVNYVKRELPMSMGVAAYIKEMSGNTIVFGEVNDKVWKDINRPPEMVDFTEAQVIYSNGEKKCAHVSNFSSFMFCIPGSQIVNDVIFFSDDGIVAKYSELPYGDKW